MITDNVGLDVLIIALITTIIFSLARIVFTKNHWFPFDKPINEERK